MAFMGPLIYLGAGLRLTATPEEVSQSQSFAIEYLAAKDYYQTNRDADPRRLIDQLTESKLAEFGVGRFIHSQYGFPLVLPDCRILPPSLCNYQPDLSYQTTKGPLAMHIKSCAFHSPLPESYLWQIGDPLLDNQTSLDWVALVRTDAKEGAIWLRALMPFATLRRLLRDPLAWRFKGSKLALYADDLIRLAIAKEKEKRIALDI